MKNRLIIKGFVLGTLLLLAGVNNIIGLGNPQVLHEEIINVFWDDWDHDHDSEGDADSDADEIGGYAKAFAEGDDVWAWIEHSKDWVCPCNVPSECKPTITIIYHYFVNLNMDKGMDVNRAILEFTTFVNDNVHIKKEIDLKNSELKISEERNYGYTFEMNNLVKGETYTIGCKAYVHTYAWGWPISGHSKLRIDHEANYFDSYIKILWNNRAPEKPSISGTKQGKVGTSYKYTAKTTDADNDPIKYKFEWGDGEESKWLGPYNSGQECQESHTWKWPGDFTIRVKAKDNYDVEGEESTYRVHMPRSKSFNYNFKFLELLLERFPNMFPIIRYILGL